MPNAVPFTPEDFTPDDGIRVNEESAIRLICQPFQSHEAGIPEWLKNSSDEYNRLGLDNEDRIILLLFRERDGAIPALFGCLDFGGVSTEKLEEKFRNWADPGAAEQEGATVEGGHGNGGKCYMVQMFSSHAYLHSVKDGRGNRYGFKANSYTPGYFDSAGGSGRNYDVPSPKDELEKALAPFGLTLEALPQDARAAWERRESFTLTAGVGAKGWNKEIPYNSLRSSIQGAQQATRSITDNKVVALHVRGARVVSQNAITLRRITPISGASASREVMVPAILQDPETAKEVETKSVEGQSRLVLKTSERDMKHWKLKGRHSINGYTHGRKKTTGYWQVPTLTMVPYSERIYGEVHLDALGDYIQNDRVHHSNSPLVRALQSWLKEQIEAYAAEFAKHDRLQATEEKKKRLSKINQFLDRWKNKFLERNRGRERDEPPTRGLPRGVPARLALSFSHSRAGVNVSFRPSLSFFDAKNRQIRPVPHHWESTDWNYATVHPTMRVVTTHAPGVTRIRAVCEDGTVASNYVDLEVIDSQSISLEPSEIEVRVGGKKPLKPIVTTRAGERVEGAYLNWVENNPEIATVSSMGMVFGKGEGTTNVVAADDRAMSSRAQVLILPADAPGTRGGKGHPSILLSEIDQDPSGEEPPRFAPTHPPVHQRVEDVARNIWWINTASPVARKILGSPKGEDSPEWRLYHLERIIEVLVRCDIIDSLAGRGMGEEDDPVVKLTTVQNSWDSVAAKFYEEASKHLVDFLNGENIDDLA